MGLVGQVIVKGADRGDFSGTGRGVQAVVRMGAVLKPDPIPAEIGHVAVNVRQLDAADKFQIHVHNTDLIQRLVSQIGITDLFHIAEEISQIQVVFVYGTLGMSLDGLVIRKEIPQDLRCFGTIIRHSWLAGYLR